MRVLPTLLALACLSFSTYALAGGNVEPHLFLTIYNSTVDEPPAYACVMQAPLCPLCFDETIHCYAEKLAVGNYGFLTVYVGRVENGFTGLAFGIQATGAAVTFLEFVPCPGYTVVLCQTGMPSAIMVTSTAGCHRAGAVGYLKYTCSNTASTFFEIVPNADFGHNKVVNCDYTLDQYTLADGRAQWGGTRTLGCVYTWVGTEALTWGKIKSLYR